MIIDLTFPKVVGFTFLNHIPVIIFGAKSIFKLCGLLFHLFKGVSNSPHPIVVIIEVSFVVDVVFCKVTSSAFANPNLTIDS